MVDNALDAVHGEKVKFGKIGDDTYWVEDTGPGIDLPADKIAELFSINRPLTSSKILRVPSRGALGNGLRVIVGTAMASGGRIQLETRNKMYQFGFNDSTGISTIIQTADSTVLGTKLTVTLGSSVPRDPADTQWATLANALYMAKTYKGKSSPWWYDSDSFYELLLAAGDNSIEWLVQQFGINDSVLDGMPGKCQSITREQSDELMGRMRKVCKGVSAKAIGHLDFSVKKYDQIMIRPGHGIYAAELPYCIEAYATPINDNPSDDRDDIDDQVTFFVNATPITGRISFERRGATKGALFGCGLRHKMDRISKRKFSLFVNVTIPYMPITTDGKEPNFESMAFMINKVISAATRKFKSAMKKQQGGGQRQIIVDNIDDAIAAASGNGTYRYSLRQLFYAIRPYILQSAENGELDYNYFARVITDYEAANGELPGIYRDPRGTLYHPHLSRSIPIGTIAVEKYERPEWTFNKILYCEKEGFFSVLNQVGWPEKNDCALLSSKGFASRAVRDVLDLIGDTEEEIQFFCIHDADASGTLIYQALTQGTTARAARRVKIIDLGLNPWEAVEANLQVENFTAKKPLPVAKYVKEYDYSNDEKWERWLQSNRVELNAMTSPMFLDWLDRKMKPYNKGKVIPPSVVLKRELASETERMVRSQVAERILREGGLEGAVQRRMQDLNHRLNDVNVGDRVKAILHNNPNQRWNQPLSQVASEVIQGKQ